MKLWIVGLLILIFGEVSGQALYWEELSDYYVENVVVKDGSVFYGTRNMRPDIYKSTDFGRTWVEEDSIYNRWLTGLYEFDNRLYVTYRNLWGYYVSVDDTGWTKIDAPYDPNWISVTESGKIYISDGRGEIQTSDDNGNSWTEIFDKFGNSSDACLIGENNLFILSGNNKLWRSEDGGGSWEEIDTPEGDYRQLVSDNDSILAIHDGENIQISYDLGDTWIDITKPDMTINKVECLDNELYICGTPLQVLDKSENRLRFLNYFDARDVLKYNDTLYNFNGKVMRTYPGYTEEMPNNFAPLNVGNAYQFFTSSQNKGPIEWEFRKITIDSTVSFNNKEYYSFSSDLFPLRFDELENRLYTLTGETESIVIDFDDATGTEYYSSEYYASGVNYNIVDQYTEEKFGASRIIKGTRSYAEQHYQFKRGLNFIEGIGPFNLTYYSFQPSYTASNGMLVEALIIEANGDTTYYTELSGIEFADDNPPVEIDTTDLIIDINLDFGLIPHYFAWASFIDTIEVEYNLTKNSQVVLEGAVVPVETNVYDLYKAYITISDSLLNSGYKLNYRISATDKGLKPETVTSPETGWHEFDLAVSNVEGDKAPTNYSLSQNYPNPFNPVTEISFSLKEAGNVKLTVFNSLGQVVQVLSDGYMNQGSHSVSFDGSTLSSGVYYYRIESGSFSDVKKMVLIK